MKTEFPVNKEIEDYMINELFSFWQPYLKIRKIKMSSKDLMKEIRNNVKDGADGIERELDCVRFESEKLDNMWDKLNWYKNYVSGISTEKETKELFGLKEDSEQKEITF